MCLIALSYQPDSAYPLRLAANRDEFHARPTAPARFWDEHPQLLAGRDLSAGGTWMGITRDGRFAAITNVRDPARAAPAPRSRGSLTTDFLLGDAPVAQQVEQIRAAASEYAGFNLILWDGGEMVCIRGGRDLDAEVTALAPGVHGLSNDRLNAPWPKLERATRVLANSLAAAPDHEALAAAVADRTLAQRQALARLGLHGEMDPLLSAQFIVTPEYGTRSTTTLWVTGDRKVDWMERNYDAAGVEQNRNRERFNLMRA